MTPIFEAIQAGDVAKLHALLMASPNDIEELDEQGLWAPFAAAKTGNLEVVRYIVEYSRASFNVVDKQNRNILHYAAHTDNVELARYLVERVGICPVSGDASRITPMDIAKKAGNLSVLSYFEEVCGAKLEDMYRNPIRTGFFPDPSILRVGDDYYMVNSSFVYFPCVPISHSKDLIHWKIIGYAVTNPEWAELTHLEGGRGFWAPDISYYNGRFYIAVTYRHNDDEGVYRRQMVVSSDKPEGPYSKPVFIDEDGIDPSIFNDDDGRRYMLLNRGARIFELSADGTKQISDAQLLWYGDNKRAPEGPHILKKDGWYYLFVAEGGTGLGHRIAVGRSRTLMGPYENCPHNPILRQNDPEAALQRAGHGKPVQTQNGDWYMIYLCGRLLDGYTVLGRETSIDPITWTADGWPMVNRLQGPSVLQKKPNLPETVWPSSGQDDFDDSTLALEWTAPRWLSAEQYRLADSKLTLIGSEADLSSVQCRGLLLRRQTDFCFKAETKMSASLSAGQDAGMAFYYDENTYVKFGLYSREDGFKLEVLTRTGPEEVISCSVPVSCNGELYLRCDVKRLERCFSYSTDGQNWSEVCTLEKVTCISDEGFRYGKRFTGAMTGIYCHGNGATADFDFYNYSSIPEEVIL